MEKFEPTKPIDMRIETNYSEMPLEYLDKEKTTLERRLNNLLEKDYNLENQIDTAAGASEISTIQENLLELETEIKRRTDNN